MGRIRIMGVIVLSLLLGSSALGYPWQEPGNDKDAREKKEQKQKQERPQNRPQPDRGQEQRQEQEQREIKEYRDRFWSGAQNTPTRPPYPLR